MGLEITTTNVQIKRFLGLNTKSADTDLLFGDISEGSALQNVNIFPSAVRQRRGSTVLNTGGVFLDSTDTVQKNITGIYEGTLGGTKHQVATGGDAFKELAGGSFTDRTGAVTITEDDDTHFTFTTFLDNAAAEVFIMANGVDAPFKWTGTGNASALGTPPGNFKFQVVHKNKLWVSVGDIVYFSALRDAETWDVANDLIRFENNGEDIEGLAVYGDNLIVFQPTAIHVISGSSNRDLFTQTMIRDEGCASGYSIQSVESKRYGTILAFLSTEGIIKGFNGSKSLLRLGDPALETFNTMNKTRYQQAVSMNYKTLNQYWVGMSFGSNADNDQVFIYDYYNDIHSDQRNGRALSTILYHTGINANAMATFTTSGDAEIPVTATYGANLLQQDFGLLDEDATAIPSFWQTGKIDFGDPSHVKMLTDLNLVTTQSSATNMAVNITTQNMAGTASMTIPASGGLWGTMLWGTGLWSAPATIYSRAEISRNPSTEEGAIIGRYFLFQFNHSDTNEAMDVNEFLIGVTDLGHQPEYTES